MLTDSDDHSVRHHQPERLRDPGVPLQPQALHHPAPPGEECPEAHDEHSQEAPGPAPGNKRKIHPEIWNKEVSICFVRMQTEHGLTNRADIAASCVRLCKTERS